MRAGNVKLLLLSALLVFTGACGSKHGSDSSHPVNTGRSLEFTGSLIIIDHNQQPVTTVDIAVADDDATRSLGLMDVREMKSDGGMLFIFEQERRQSFWMANTPLPLDLIFADQNGRIVHIHSNARPFSHDQIDSRYPALYVLEVNAGFAMTHDIQVGHTIAYTL